MAEILHDTIGKLAFILLANRRLMLQLCTPLVTPIRASEPKTERFAGERRHIGQLHTPYPYMYYGVSY